jgi:hypothetical protein
MFQLDGKFLDEVGLGSLPDEQKKAFLEYFREQLELRVGTKLSDGLSDEQLDEFESFMDRDEAKVDAWLAANAPNYQQEQSYQKLKTAAPEGTSAVAVKSEFASLRWLGLNRPNYRDVVSSVMKALRDETIANRDAILGQNQ